MRICVCIKHVPDTAANIRPLEGTSFDETVKFIMNPYDEYALEQALRLREGYRDVEVIAITVGRAAAAASLRQALAVGADRAILVKTDTYFTDSIETARLLHAALSRDGLPDLILTGRQSVDTEGMQIPYRLGALFDIPVAVDAVAFTMTEGRVTIEREGEGGAREAIEMTMPCVVGAARGLNQPRLATLPEMMKARKREIQVIPQPDFGLPAPSSSVELLGLQTTLDRGRGRLLEGEPEEMAWELLRLLREEAKVL